MTDPNPNRIRFLDTYFDIKLTYGYPQNGLPTGRLKEEREKPSKKGAAVNTTVLSKLPVNERPRERLLQQGIEGLSIIELLAIFLGTGTRGKSVVELAEEMLMHFGGLKGLLDASIPELMEIRGIGQIKAIQLKAMFGIILKSIKSAQPYKNRFKDAQQIFEFAKPEIAYQKQETLLVILRDIRGQVLHHERVSVGTLTEVLVHPREVFYLAVRHKAYSMIIAHNHPSGDPKPSQADIDLTHRLLEASQIMGIPLDDHLIITPYAYVSLKERGEMQLPKTQS